MNILSCGHWGEFFGRLTLRRVMELESGSERFCVPKTSFQENALGNNAVPASTKYKNKWAASSGIRLWWSLQGLRFSQGYRFERRYCRNGRSVAELLVVKIRDRGS